MGRLRGIPAKLLIHCRRYPGAGAAIGRGVGLGAGALIGDLLQGQEIRNQGQQQIQADQAEIERQRMEIERIRRKR